MLETERLILKPIKQENLPWLIEMRTPDAVNRYLGGPEKQNADALTKRIRDYIDWYEKSGFGVCVMELKTTGEWIGTSGLQPLEETGEIEVGYNLSEKYWRQGYGYECCDAWLRYGFESAGLTRIVAVAHPDNTGSWRIMEKCGMRFDGIEKHYGMDVKSYSIAREEFVERNARSPRTSFSNL